MSRPVSLVVCAALFAAACAETPSEPQADAALIDSPQLSSSVAGDRVTGHWGITFAGGYDGDYSMNAMRRADGSVTGEWELHELAPDGTPARLHGDVVCMNILPDGHTARLGGIIERSSAAGMVGRAAVWIVSDNGEGKASSDQASDIRFGYRADQAQYFCDNGFNLGVFEPVERGNIQVR